MINKRNFFRINSIAAEDDDGGDDDVLRENYTTSSLAHKTN